MNASDSQGTSSDEEAKNDKDILDSTPSGTSAYAILALVFGICSLFFWCLTGVPGIIFGHMALAEIKRGEASEDGRVLAIAGLVISYIVTGLSLLVFFVYMFFIIAAVAAPLAVMAGTASQIGG